MPDVGAQRAPDQGPGHDLHPVPLLQLHGGRGHLPAPVVLQPARAGVDAADRAGPVPRAALALAGAGPTGGEGAGGATPGRTGEMAFSTSYLQGCWCFGVFFFFSVYPF